MTTWNQEMLAHLKMYFWDPSKCDKMCSEYQITKFQCKKMGQNFHICSRSKYKKAKFAWSFTCFLARLKNEVLTIYVGRQMQLQQRILNATKKSQLPGLKHSALAVPSSQAEDFFASRLKKVFLRKGEPYNRHDSGSKDRGFIFRQGCFLVPQTINVQMMSHCC